MAKDPVAAEQARLVSDLDQVQAYGHAHAQHFGGAYWDNQQPVTIVALFTADVDRHRAALQRLMQYPDRLVVRSTPQTLRQMVAEKDAVAAILLPRTDLGVWGVGIGGHGRHFAVHVHIDPYSPEIARQITALVRPHHVIVEPGGPYHAR